jgi:hypothetical protein
MLDLLRRFGLYIERRKPPVQGVETANGLGDITACFEADAARLSARYEAARRNGRRRPPDDAFLRQGEAWAHGSATS